VFMLVGWVVWGSMDCGVYVSWMGSLGLHGLLCLCELAG
jgi:hypothetical protein